MSRSADGATVVTLDHDTQTRIGLATQPLVTVSQRPQLTAYGVALDPAPLVALNAELPSAEAALAASQAEFERLQRLYRDGQNMSRKSLEPSRSALSRRSQPRRLAARQIAAAWGDAVSGLTAAERDALVKRLVTPDTVLVRANLPAGEARHARPPAAKLVVLGYEDQPLTAGSLFDAPTVDPSTQNQGYVLRVDSPGAALRPGAAVTAYLELSGEPREGVVIPPSAVVRFDGAAWAHVQVNPEALRRTQVANPDW